MLGGFLVVAVSLLGFVVYQFVSVYLLVDGLPAQLDKITAIDSVYEGLLVQFNAVDSYLLSGDESYARQFFQDAGTNQQELRELARVIRPSRQPLVRGIDTGEQAYVDLVAKQVLPAARAGDYAGAALTMRRNGAALEERMLDLTREVRNLREADTAGMTSLSVRQLKSALGWGFGCGMFVFAASIVAGILVNRRIVMEGMIHRLVLLTTKNAVAIVDGAGRIYDINPVAERFFGALGLSRQEMLGRPYQEFFSGCHQSDGTALGEVIGRALTTGDDICDVECTYGPRDRTVATLLTDCLSLRHGGRYGLVLIFRDITERKATEERLRGLTVRDSMTALYNHAYLLQVLEDEVTRAAAGGGRVAFLMIDVDHFKDYNDQFGHPEGDKVLIQLSRLLENMVRKNDVVARYGGDEFAVVLPGADLGQALEVGNRLKEAVSEYPFPHRELTVSGQLTISVGIACCPDDSSTVAELIKRADAAMYSAKRNAKNNVEVWHSAFKELRADWPDDSLLYTVGGFLSIVSDKDRYTYGHSEKVALYTAQLARWAGLPEEEVKRIKLAAYLHDLGKVDVPAGILTKPGPLTAAERSLCQAHAVTGARIVGQVEELLPVVPIIRHHHERYDGKGYPDGLYGTHIPLGARIIAIADSFDAMISERPYRRPRSVVEALAELEREAGRQFDPGLARIFVEESRRHSLVIDMERGMEDGPEESEEKDTA